MACLTLAEGRLQAQDELRAAASRLYLCDTVSIDRGFGSYYGDELINAEGSGTDLVSPEGGPCQPPGSPREDSDWL